MESKRRTFEAPSASASNSFSSILDPELHQRLSTVGPRVRKQVSEGHLTPGSSLPSFEGLTVGTLDQERLRQEFLSQIPARPYHTTGDIGIKRVREDELGDDEYGDTEDDEAQPSVDTAQKTYYRPLGHRSHSGQNDDFTDAPFLK